MRLRHGPHKGRLTEWVLLRAPDYVVRCLAERPEGGLASVFVDLIARFDALPFKAVCSGCGGPAEGACAYPALTALVVLCEACLARAEWGRLAGASRIASLEDALRHVAETFRRSSVMHQRRIVASLAEAKGGPLRATEVAVLDFFHGPGARMSPPWNPAPTWAELPPLTHLGGQSRSGFRLR